MDIEQIKKVKRVRFNTTLNQWILIKLKVLAAATQRDVNYILEDLSLEYIPKTFDMKL
ncbi:hypothetical protein [Clostridium drakei]|uniref:hypothetical protein n=1 Tax=Clostridium drakei TaxID=332101 RepID=UPI000AE6C5DB|nr:hypothetical protein [Clostridium drakei]